MEEGNRGKPIQCLLEITGVAEVSGRKVAVCVCSNHICGCRWKGAVNDYLLYHKLMCNFQVIWCGFCWKEMLKGHFINHLMLECQQRHIVDCTITYEKEDFYGCQECPNTHLGCKWEGTCAIYEKVHRFQCNQDVVCFCGNIVKKLSLTEHLSSECVLQLNLQPGTDFSDYNKPSEFNNKPIKDLWNEHDISEQEEKPQIKN